MKQHPVHNEIYVTKDGRVFRELTPSVDSGGYHQIRNGKFRQRRHVLVLETYHGPRPEGAVSRHLNGDPRDDRPENLAWGSQSENLLDSVRHGTHRSGALITEKQRAEIKQRRASGESGKSLAAEYGISQQRVCDIYKDRK